MDQPLLHIVMLKWDSLPLLWQVLKWNSLHPLQKVFRGHPHKEAGHHLPQEVHLPPQNRKEVPLVPLLMAEVDHLLQKGAQQEVMLVDLGHNLQVKIKEVGQGHLLVPRQELEQEASQEVQQAEEADHDLHLVVLSEVGQAVLQVKEVGLPVLQVREVGLPVLQVKEVGQGQEAQPAREAGRGQEVLQTEEVDPDQEVQSAREVGQDQEVLQVEKAGRGQEAQLAEKVGQGQEVQQEVDQHQVHLQEVGQEVQRAEEVGQGQGLQLEAEVVQGHGQVEEAGLVHLQAAEVGHIVGQGQCHLLEVEHPHIHH